MLPLKKTLLPSWDLIGQYLTKSYGTGHFTNFGPLHQSLIDFLAEFYSASPPQVALFSSATSALSASISHYRMETSSRKEFTVLMPSWTFAATAQSALFVGCNVLFCDVGEAGFLTPEIVRKSFKSELRHCIDLVLPVVPFGAHYSPISWEDFNRETGIPVVIDCAAGFLTAVPSHLPTIVSTHATKFFPTAEGGFVLCKDSQIVESLKSLSNFGFDGSRISTKIGTNAKLSEFHCAVGLAFRDSLLERMSDTYRVQSHNYDKLFANSVFRSFGASPNLPSSTYNVVLDCQSDEGLLDRITSRMVTLHGIEVRRWWHSPLHTQPAFEGCAVIGSMTNTERLNQSVIGLPFGFHVNQSAQESIVESLILSLSKCS